MDMCHDLKREVMRKTLETFIQHLKNERFVEAHEEMEQQWKQYKKQGHPLTKLLKGYINGATVFELVRREKMEGARGLWEVYEKYHPLLQEGIEEHALFAEADSVLQGLKMERLR